MNRMSTFTIALKKLSYQSLLLKNSFSFFIFSLNIEFLTNNSHNSVIFKMKALGLCGIFIVSNSGLEKKRIFFHIIIIFEVQTNNPDYSVAPQMKALL